MTQHNIDYFSQILHKKQHWLGKAIFRWRGYVNASLFGVISSVAITTPVFGADRIDFYYPPFGDFSISTNDLELFAKQGKITSDFAFYTKRAKPEQLAQLREFLQTKFNISPTLVSQFTYSPIGEKILQRLGELVQVETRQNGFYALRSTLILSAADPEGLTLINILRRYPSPSIRLNFSETINTFGQLSDLLKKRDAVVAALQQLADNTTQAQIDFSQQPDIRLAGGLSSEKITLNLRDRSRKNQSGAISERNLDVDLYLPQSRQNKTDSFPSPFPVIVISHGLAEDRNTFAYLAKHLVSYGFAVAVIEHPETNSKDFQQFLSGFASTPQATDLINRPLDVKYLLDELQRLNDSDVNLKGKFNLKQVGVIGHSLGGYTALALAGATINFQQVRKDCIPNRSLNLSVFLQCGALELQPGIYPIKDDRVKAILAFNPLSSTIFGSKGVSQIQIPTMLLASSQDIFTPPVPEQIFPFTRLPNPDKYLALIENGTHFTVEIDPPPSQTVIPVPNGLLGPDRTAAYSYVKALSVAFFETHLVNKPNYRPYLSESYARFISKAPLNLSLINSSSSEEIAQLLSKLYPQFATSNKLKIKENSKNLEKTARI
ncbi:alpha/beta hydrolase [Plectonema radiosum NIES-515]|uniref:Alpha/beta hydrolase n=2 Tax=Plectonema TaxID=1183 RepID=A0ABT3AVM4_9CYAN|nr:alpha/beta hydrolase [Plectonema radiosum NIES-515]